jgi:6-phosphogluconate dehydrogenase
VRIGLVGLGRMGANMAERWRENGIDVVGFDIDPTNADVASLADLVDALDGDQRRVAWVMVPAGAPTEATITELAARLGEGDLVVDGGNSNYRDSQRRHTMLAEHGLGFVDAGVSGGIWGRDAGYCIMAGGDPTDIADLAPIFDALVTTDGFAHVGPVGAGHFAKMVHNGVEYAMMQAFAEGYELMSASEVGVDVPAAMEVWRHGSVVRSWILDLLADALRADPTLSSVRGWADDSGEGRWTVNEAVASGVPAPAITAALYARFASRQDDSPAMRAIAILRQQFGGHPVVPPEVP